MKKMKGMIPMKKFRKIAAVLLTVAMLFSLAACNGNQTNPNEPTTKEPGTQEVGTNAPADGQFKIGVVQLMEHDALDAAREGFEDVLNELMPGQYVLDVQNAQGEQNNCTTIVNKFVSSDYDLILAIATPAAQAAKQATSTIPILVTAVTDPADSKLCNTNEVPGGNLTGTSDMNPIDEQSDLLLQLAPEAKTVGIFYNSGEDNSVLQYNIAKEAFEEKGLTVQAYTVADSSQIQTVAQSAVGKIDAAYIGTDNLLASSMPIISQVLTPAGIPIICGEANMVENGGTATYGLNYYELGRQTGAQAKAILVDGKDPATMPIEYCENLDFTVNEDVLSELGIELPEELASVLAAQNAAA